MAKDEPRDVRSGPGWQDPEGWSHHFTCLASDIITILDEHGAIRYQSPSIEEVLGYRPEELVGRNAYDYVHRDDVQRVLEAFNEEMAHGETGRRVEFRFKHADGSWRYLESVGRNLLDNPEVSGILVTSRDVTDRKKAEEELKESEERYRAVVQQFIDGILLMDVRSKRILQSNPSMQNMSGYAADELEGMSIHELSAAPRQDVDADLERTLKEKSRFVSEHKIRRKDGTVLDVEAGSSVISYGGREVVCAVVRDVTERKKGEKRLKEAEARLRTLVEQIPVITYTEGLRENGKVVHYMSPQYEILLGYSLKEEVSRPEQWLKLVHPDDREVLLSEDARTDKTLEPFKAEYRMLARDGQVVWVRDEAVVVRDEDGNPLFWQGVMYDITDQKVAQDELLRSEARFRSVVESIGEGLLITDADDIVKYANPRLTEITGYAREEMLGRPAYELLVPPEQRQKQIERTRRRMEGIAERYETQLRRKDGGTIWVEIHATPYREATGELVGTLGAVTDITERKRTESALEESEQRFRQLFEQSVDALFVHDERGRFVDCNSRACRLLGYSREELLSMSVQDVSNDILTADEKRKREQRGGTLWQRALAGAPGTFALSHEERNVRKDGSVFPAEVRVGSVDYGGRRMILTSVRDIAGRKQTEEELRESEERHRRQARELSLLYQVSTMLAEAHDPTTVFRTVVEAVAQTFGYALISAYLLEDESLLLQHQVGHEQIIELIPVSQGVSGRVVRTRQPVLLKDVREDESFQDARESITSAICVPVFDQGKVIGTLNVESVGEVVLAEADLRLLSALGEQVGAAVGRAQLYAQAQASKVRLVHQAFHDPLTGLANRALLMDRIAHVLARAQRQRETVAVLFMDLDNFKVINDSLGHETGDRLLVKAAERLRTCVRPQDTVARMGGDEFVALLEGLSDVDDAIRVAERIIREVRVPFVIGGHRLHTSTSVGIAINTTSGRDLLRAADIAMYRAKAAGQGSYEVFEPDMHDRALDRLKLETDLRTSLERGELGVRYQPQVSLDNGKVVAVEALLRWQHPKRGLLLPRDFLPLAEQTGLIVPIGEWILLEACRQARAWQERLPDGEQILASVNLSVRQLRQTDFVSQILSESGLQPANLVLEITEDAVMEDAHSSIGVLEDLKASGVRLAIDDFGTGYSSLSYLKRLPVHYLKIDRSFVEKLPMNTRDAEIVSATIALAQALDLETIAEGVETVSQFELLREMGCDLAQGNYISEPLTAAGLHEYLEQDRGNRSWAGPRA